jgi:hypothetical protein
MIRTWLARFAAVLITAGALMALGGNSGAATAGTSSPCAPIQGDSRSAAVSLHSCGTPCPSHGRPLTLCPPRCDQQAFASGRDENCPEPCWGTSHTNASDWQRCPCVGGQTIRGVTTGDDQCGPDPILPEAPSPLLLPATAFAVGIGACVVVWRRRRKSGKAA